MGEKGADSDVEMEEGKVEKKEKKKCRKRGA